jgi:hypothetical protein
MAIMMMLFGVIFLMANYLLNFILRPKMPPGVAYSGEAILRLWAVNVKWLGASTPFSVIPNEEITMVVSVSELYVSVSKTSPSLV